MVRLAQARTRLLASAALALGMANAGCKDRPHKALVAHESHNKLTDGDVAFTNFEGQVSESGKLALANPSSLGAFENRVGMLLARTQYRGTYNDFAEVARMIDTAEQQWPASPNVRLVHAKFLSQVHKFEASLQLLDQITPTASNQGKIADLYCTIYQATGAKPEFVTKHRSDMLAKGRTFESTSAMAGWEAQQGHYAEADELYDEAAKLYRDTSPFPLAWVAFQRGVMWSEMADQPAKGIPFYQAAVAMLPGYVAANVHLGEKLAPMGAAHERLVAMLETSNDPEIAMVLASAAATPADRATFIERARVGYEALLQQFPEAFWDHAAEFYLDQGNDSRKALDFASKNWALRKTPRSKDLLERATTAAGAAGTPVTGA